MLDFHITVINDSEKLDRIENKLNTLTAQGVTLMATIEEMNQELVEINQQTDEIAGDIDNLIERLANGGLTPEQEAEVLGQLKALNARTKSIAAQHTA